MVEGARSQRDPVELLLDGGDKRGMTVPEVCSRVRREEIQILPTAEVGEHRAGCIGYHNVKRVVVVSDVLILELQQVAGRGEGLVHDDHDDAPALSLWCSSRTSLWRRDPDARLAGLICWVQHFTLPPPLISSLRSIEIGQ